MNQQSNNAMHLSRHQALPVHHNETLRPGDGQRSINYPIKCFA
jgi:hypothetical protein